MNQEPKSHEISIDREHRTELIERAQVPDELTAITQHDQQFLYSHVVVAYVYHI